MNTNPYSIPRNWLVWEWNLDWNALDTSWNWNNWTPTNITWWTDSSILYQRWYAIFNANWWISTTAQLINTSWSYIISCWIKTRDTTSLTSINYQYDWYLLYMDWWKANLKIRQNTSPTWIDCLSTSNINTWEWVFITAVISPTSAKIYINWKLENTSSYIDLTTNTNTIQIGSSNALFSPVWFTWYVSWTKIFNRVLLDTEIRNLYMEWKRLLWLPAGYRYQPTANTKLLLDLEYNSNDRSWNSNNWTDTNITYVDTLLGKSASFNGSSSLISIADNNNLSPSWSFTLSFWMKVTAYNWWFVQIVWKWWETSALREYGFWENNDWKLCFYIAENWSFGWNSTSVWITKPAVWEWHHIVCVFTSNGYLKISLNWEQIAYTVANFAWVQNLWANFEIWKCSQNFWWASNVFNWQIKWLIFDTTDWSASKIQEEFVKQSIFYKSLPLWLQNWLKLWIDWSNNGSWTFYDVMRNNNWTGVNSPTVSNLLQHKIITLNWSNQYLTLPNWVANWYTDFTLSCQFNVSNLSQNNWLFYLIWDSGYSFFAYIDNSNWVRVSVYNGSTNTLIDVPLSYFTANKWYYFVWTRDSSWNWKVYINWVLVNTWSQHTISLSNTAWNTIWNVWWSYMNWSIANPMIYNRVLSAEEIYQLYISNFIF